MVVRTLQICSRPVRIHDLPHADTCSLQTASSSLEFQVSEKPCNLAWFTFISPFLAEAAISASKQPHLLFVYNSCGTISATRCRRHIPSAILLGCCGCIHPVCNTGTASLHDGCTVYQLRHCCTHCAASSRCMDSALPLTMCLTAIGLPVLPHHRRSRG